MYGYGLAIENIINNDLINIFTNQLCQRQQCRQQNVSRRPLMSKIRWDQHARQTTQLRRWHEPVWLRTQRGVILCINATRWWTQPERVWDSDIAMLNVQCRTTSTEKHPEFRNTIPLGHVALSSTCGKPTAKPHRWIRTPARTRVSTSATTISTVAGMAIGTKVSATLMESASNTTELQIRLCIELAATSPLTREDHSRLEPSLSLTTECIPATCWRLGGCTRRMERLSTGDRSGTPTWEKND